ncbi:MAG: PilZ domain-containing protein [Alphaproteobacteria bacterium]|nr:PilZ domain-containing protein [Alphaproteobacteria bacterium]MBV9418843.1 PilZ domain-containing protein [Alphaproteobacteria bacterium]MBV9541357.1 PilZ domain-containing protein [Alphaproteobacteria bacterium]MBV9905692.1 PilZ domain-containing protein [Alphaproteobacteria bacterium]
MSNAAMKPAEKRAFPRTPITLAGKIFLPVTGVEQNCIVSDISMGGATLQADTRLRVGTEVVLYLPGFDRFSGTIVHSGAVECGMRFSCSPAKRERTGERIVLYLNGALPDMTRERRTTRMAMPAPRYFTRPNGERVRFEVRDISLSGASLKTEMRPPVGEIVMVGTTAGRVARHFDGGIALEFVRTLSAPEL